MKLAPILRRASVLCLMLGVAACASHPPVSRAPASGPTGPGLKPDTYLGLSGVALREQLGPPAFVRKDGASQLWRYDGAECRAFFFLEDAKGSASVRHVETLPRGKTQAADPACLAALRLSPPKTS
jgi:hypothetical protein